MKMDLKITKIFSFKKTPKYVKSSYWLVVNFIKKKN